MATEKVSLTLDEELIGEARQSVGSRGLSGYVNRALRNQLQHDRLTKLLEDFDDGVGPVDPRVMAEVREEWPAREVSSERRRSA